ncbi:MAG: DMT family transporter [Vicinamibacterales bacterium]
MTYRVALKPIDLLLLLMTVIWGGNFTVVKIAARHIPELPFNSLRLLVASAAFLCLLGAREGWPRLSRDEWRRIVALAVVGHVVYQLCFIGAVKRTTVANSALIFAFTPIVVALLTSVLGHERIPPPRWAGALISLAGIYLVVGARAGGSEATTAGNILAVAAMLCWALYTVGARPLLTSRSALAVTGYSMAVGSLLYVPIAWSGLRALRWSAVPAGAWAALVLSALLALFVAYMIWYTAVQTIGGSRTSMYSNVTPLVAMAVAAIWLGEPVTLRKLAGAALVIAGLAVTKLERQPDAREALPPVET